MKTNLKSKFWVSYKVVIRIVEYKTMHTYGF